MTDLDVPLLRLPSHDVRLALPGYETAGSAGMDLRACLAPDDRERGLVMPPLGRVLVSTGLALALPEGFEGQVRPRSGLAVRHGITVLNAPGTIDSDYRGEIKVPLINLGERNHTICHGDRIAQLVVAAYARVALEEVPELAETQRGAGGFGSTGRG